MNLNENEIRTLVGLVTNNEEWGLLKKIFRHEIDLFWDRVRLTDPADEKRVTANHKIALGLEASLGDLVNQLEEVVKVAQNPTPKELPDLTAEFFCSKYLYYKYAPPAALQEMEH
jgi:hypothetical protein